MQLRIVRRRWRLGYRRRLAGWSNVPWRWVLFLGFIEVQCLK
jgi:hypothetical protein